MGDNDDPQPPISPPSTPPPAADEPTEQPQHAVEAPIPAAAAPKVDTDEDDQGRPLSPSPTGSPASPKQPSSTESVDVAPQVDSLAEQQPSGSPVERPPTPPSNPTSPPLPAPPAVSSSSSSPAQQAPTPPLAPAKRRPKPPARGILKPPPPPVKPTFGNRLRDIVGSVTGEPPAPSPHSGAAAHAAVGALNAISGRLGLGFNRFAPKDDASPPPTPPKPQQGAVRRAVSLSEEQFPPPPPPQEPAVRKQPLKRATFVLPSMSITYPISALAEPWSAKVLDERQKIETRQRMLLATAQGAEYWTSMRLIKLYEAACRGREEKPRLGLIRALQALPASPKPRIIHLILHDTPGQPQPYPRPYPLEHPLTRYSAEAFADMLVVEWALSDLRLERGVVDTEEALKPILHALLISGTLPSLSLAGNRKIKAGGWRLVAVFLKRARSLKFMDLSETNWDKKGVDYLVQALNSTHIRPALGNDLQGGPSTPPSRQNSGSRAAGQPAEERPYGGFLPPAPLLRDDMDRLPAAVETLRLDSCNFRSHTLEALAQGVRSSELKHISLRHNRIGPLSAVAIAVMIRDYPDTISTFGTTAGGESGSGMVSNATYASYTPRARRGTPEVPTSDDANLPPIPLVVSSSTGGVTSRVVPDGYKPPPPPKYPLVMPGGGYSAMQDSAGFALSSASVEGKMTTSEHGGASLALQRNVRALDGIERIGRLVTLDLKSNEIGKGVTYIAQVLKRNRTLKVLNLSDNKLEPAGLVALAEALKYNPTLETLDISSNQCCGPSLEGIAALRTSFTVNNSLKRLFLPDTGLTTEGAIDLAEFIPENRSLLHLDVTANPSVGTAGILALASGLKANQFIRCLDVSIPPNDPNLADLSQSILQSCIRNTELAAATVKDGKPARAAQDAIWRPIKKSSLVRQVKAADELRAQKEREQVALSIEGVARDYVYRLKPENLATVAEETSKELELWYAAAAAARARPMGIWEHNQMPKEDFRPLVERAKALTERIADSVTTTVESDQLERLLGLNDVLTTHIRNAKGFAPPPRILLPSQIALNAGAGAPAAPVVTPAAANLTPRRRHTRSTSLEISSPNFSIGDSDNESDAEELDATTLAGPSGNPPVGIISPSKKTSRLESVGPSASTPPRPTPAEQPESGIPSTSAAADAAAEQLVNHELEQGLDQLSPVERTSRKWVEEEAEIFRKGTKLGVAEDSDDEDDDGGRRSCGGGDGDGSDSAGESARSVRSTRSKESLTGEQLRQDLLETEVPRDSPRTVVELSDEEVERGGEGEAER